MVAAYSSPPGGVGEGTQGTQDEEGGGRSHPQFQPHSSLPAGFQLRGEAWLVRGGGGGLITPAVSVALQPPGRVSGRVSA